MKEFLKWAKAHGIKFKRSRDQDSAYAVWKALKAEHESSLHQLGAALNDLDKERVKLNG